MLAALSHMLIRLIERTPEYRNWEPRQNCKLLKELAERTLSDPRRSGFIKNIMEGTAEEILIHAKEYARVKDRLNKILIKHTGHTMKKIENDTDRDNFMTAEEALKYKLIDHVIENMQLAE